MTTPDIVSVIKDIVSLLAVVIGALVVLFVYFQFAPVLSLRIAPTWIGKKRSLLLIRIEVENKARVRLHSPKGKIQVLKYSLPAQGFLSQWVPFERGTIPKEESPIEWREPIEIFNTTKEIYPGETIAYERLYHIPEDTVIVHIGLQVEMKLGGLGRLVTGKKENWRQTTTCFAVKSANELIEN